MPITKEQAKRLRHLMTARVNAAVEHSWKGSQPPDERAQIEEDLLKAEQRLDNYVKNLMGE